MAKLYFYYAAMNAGKSTTLLQADFNYRERGMETMLWTAALDERIGKGEQGRRAGEKVGLEVGAQAVAEDGDRKVVGDAAELEDVIAGEELGFVDQHAMQFALLQFLGDLGQQVDAFVVGAGRRIEGDARTDGPAAGAIVEAGGPQHGFHAALAIIEIGLKQGRRFPRVHRRIIEIELGH
jgi:hypothetical protein